jgi:predicted RNA-binding Zn-ribbon protein involved in translation (DUF1610 family)
MFPKHKKITNGFVVQTYMTLPDGTLVCVDQEFIAGDPVDYENMEGDPVEVDVDKEVYCPFEMKRPKQIPDPDKAVKFLCPDCGHTRIEAVMDGSHTTIVDGMFKGGGMEYGDTEAEGDLQRFQCVGCGRTIVDDDGERSIEDQDPITDEEQLVEWCQENCSQE